MSHRRRIAALERRLAPANPEPTLIRITGGLPDSEPMGATVGGQEFEREVDETLRAFEARVLDAAKAAGQQIVVVGGTAGLTERSRYFIRLSATALQLNSLTLLVSVARPPHGLPGVEYG